MKPEGSDPSIPSSSDSIQILSSDNHMTCTISIDESGNLGKDSRFFVMAATMVMRQRHLLSVSKKIPKQREESKFYNSTEEEIMAVLNELSLSDAHIVYVVVDKHDYTGRFYKLRGNSLYEAVLREVLMEAFATINGGDVNIFLDRSSFLTLNSFRTIAREITTSASCNLKKCDKVTSHQNKCVQIADYVAGAINRNYEDNDPHYMEIIRDKISIARKN